MDNYELLHEYKCIRCNKKYYEKQRLKPGTKCNCSKGNNLRYVRQVKVIKEPS